MVVKGSKQYRSKVIPYRPLRRVIGIVVLLMVVVAAAFSSYRYGYVKAQSDYQQAMEEWNHLHELASQQAEQLQQLNQQVVNTHMDSNVNQQTVEELRRQLVVLNDQITSLQESNNFYARRKVP